jgi:YbbR domain-containing protein
MRDLFIKDWGWKLFSLFLAVAIWLTVHRILEPEETSLTGRTSTVTYENLAVHIVASAADVSLYRVTPAVVKVEVSGPPDVMDQLQESQVRAVVDLTGNLTGRAAASGPVNIITPPNVTLVEVEPAVVLVIPPPKQPQNPIN